jgi:LysR family cyn operon transcriptional activator
MSIGPQKMPRDHMEALLGADEIDLGITFDAVHLAGIDTRVLFVETLGLGLNSFL